MKVRATTPRRRDQPRQARPVRQRGEAHDPETALRQRMRLHPTTRLMSSHPEVSPILVEAEPSPLKHDDSAKIQGRRAIVSINGKDVDVNDLELNRRTA